MPNKSRFENSIIYIQRFQFLYFIRLQDIVRKKCYRKSFITNKYPKYFRSSRKFQNAVYKKYPMTFAFISTKLRTNIKRSLK